MQQRWNLKTIYSTDQDWEKDFSSFSGEITQLKEKILEIDFENEIGKVLSGYFSLEKKVSKIYVYAHLKYDEDLSNNTYKEMYGKALFLSNELQENFCWIEPRILEIEDASFKKLLNDPKLTEFHVYLNKVYRLKSHTLDQEKEQLLVLSAPALSGASKAFSAFNNADLTFEKAVDKEGVKHPLTQAMYSNYLRQPDRVLRKDTFEKVHKGYEGHENLLCELLTSQVNKHNFYAKAKNYANCLESALFPNAIDPAIFHHLIKTSKKNFSSLHQYISLRKKTLGVEELYPYDLYVSLVKECKIEMPFNEAVDLVIESVLPLGDEYQKVLSSGLKERGWVDPFEQKGKRSGAYSSGCYGSEPYILMNYHNNLNDIFTLAHEAGHSMHSYLSNQNQTYQDSQYSIFLAEIASTFNELLLLKALKEKYKGNKEVELYLLLHQIDSFRATFFRQVQFAEFEEIIHKKIENSEPLTPQFLKEVYLKLNEEYYGKDLTLDPYLAVEWARIPHFYYNFYVYQYATGISIAYYFFNKVEKDPSMVKPYLQFLSSGGADYPLNILEICGVDLLKGNIIEDALSSFTGLVSELEGYLAK